MQDPPSIAALRGPFVVRVGLALLFATFYVDAFLIGAEAPAASAFALLALPVAAGLLETTRGLAHPVRPRAADVIAGLIGALAVAAGIRLFGFSPVLAAALVGLAGGLVGTRWKAAGSLAAPLYCGSFAGMTSPLVLVGIEWVALAGLLAGVLFSMLRSSWDGVGGKLGLLAFVGVVGATSLAHLVGVRGPGASLGELGAADLVAVLLSAASGTASTHRVRTRLNASPVLASSATTAVFALVLAAIEPDLPFAAAPAAIAWFGGSFIAMSATGFVARARRVLPLAAGLYALFQAGFEPMLAGLGGDFGATAAISVLAVVGTLPGGGRTRRIG